MSVLRHSGRVETVSCVERFQLPNSQDTVCDACGKTERSFGNTTNLLKHLRSNHKEYESFMMRGTEGKSPVSGAAARVRQMSLEVSFGTAGRHYPGTERDKYIHNIYNIY